MPVAPAQVRTKARNRDAESTLIDALGIPRLAAAVLVGRGITEPDDALAFLYPDLNALGDPARLPDFASAADVVLGAIERKERIYVHGDYDVDGVTSAALFSRFLKKVGADVYTHVPHRMKEGYGIHLLAVEEARQMGAKVFLTCDCGIGAHEQVQAAREAGMTVVVTDHHTVPPVLPEAAAVVNPHRTDSDYPFSELSGVGVVFRFCEGLARNLKMPIDGYRRAYLDLAVLGTVADVMPLVGENRIITHHGLRCLKQTNKEGLQALLRVAKLAEADVNLNAMHIGFQLGPRLNAAGRIDDAAHALRLLLSRDQAEADQIAGELDKINQLRRDIQDQSVQEAIEMVETLGLHEEHAIVLGSSDFHAGIIGLIAGKIRERYNRPAFVLQFNTETGEFKASARSIPGFHLADAIRSLHPLIEGGGHAMAAGFSGRLDQISEVREAIEGLARQWLTKEDLVPIYDVDAAVDGDEVTLASLRGLSMLEPFGMGNPRPTFAMRNVKLMNARPTKNPRIAQLQLCGPGGKPTKGTSFSQGPEALEWAGMEVDIVFKPEIDTWNGRERLEFKVEYMTPSGG